MAPKKAGRARVFLVDDHALVREGLAMLLRSQRDLSVCGQASTAEDARKSILADPPDLAIVDISLDGSSGLDLVKDLGERCPGLPILVLSMHEESVYAERVLRAGARGYVMKKQVGQELLAAVRRVLAGKIYLSDRMSEGLLGSLVRRGSRRQDSPLQQLTDRELEVFGMIGQGLKTGRIAQKLHVSVKTIETHRARIKQKLDIKDSAKLAHHASLWNEKL